ncbi:MAG TPA: SpoIIIAH-like family protein [Haloplasmataceae bacterium]
MKPQGKVTIFMIVMIVMLSIYYFALPNNNNPSNTTDVGNISNKSEEFEQLRNQLQEKRYEMIASLQEILASAEVGVEEKNTAIEAIQKIHLLSQNEALLETRILNLGYDDVFVEATETSVVVWVYVDNLTIDEVNEIFTLAKSEFGSYVDVSVHYTITGIN